MASNGSQERQGRETRLLMLVVVVSIAVLLLLARLRFPAAELVATVPPPGPLAGLAKQAAFDDLAQTMSALLARVSQRLVIVELAETRPPSRGQPEPPSPVAAILVRPDIALAYVPTGLRPSGIVSAGTAGEAVDVIVADPQRDLALLRVTPPADVRAEPAVENFTGFSYVGVVDATKGGLTIQPVFVGRVGPRLIDAWPGGLFTIDHGLNVPIGSFVFSIDSRLVGLVIRDKGAAALVPASVLETVVTGLVPGGSIGP